MAGGLFALLDDVALIARQAAASTDDVASMAAKTSAKAAGVVIDDTAVTPQYVSGVTPARELPMIWKITKGSLRNKLLIILPVALLTSASSSCAEFSAGCSSEGKNLPAIFSAPSNER